MLHYKNLAASEDIKIEKKSMPHRLDFSMFLAKNFNASTIENKMGLLSNPQQVKKEENQPQAGYKICCY